jgi:FKBP-type peptidyl-prolyl cis-trans isomerase FkpA
MKKIFFLMALFSLSISSCKKKDTCPYTESGISATVAERTYLETYLAANTLPAIQHTSGVFYNITVPGSGLSPTICSNITIKYTGSFIPSGMVFDHSPAGSPGVNFTLGELIVGWQKILPLLKIGGKVTLYIPPSLGYGARNYPNDTNIAIPANSYLKFEIELVNVQ